MSENSPELGSKKTNHFERFLQACAIYETAINRTINTSLVAFAALVLISSCNVLPNNSNSTDFDTTSLVQPTSEAVYANYIPGELITSIKPGEKLSQEALNFISRNTYGINIETTNDNIVPATMEAVNLPQEFNDLIPNEEVVWLMGSTHGKIEKDPKSIQIFPSARESEEAIGVTVLAFSHDEEHDITLIGIRKNDFGKNPVPIGLNIRENIVPANGDNILYGGIPQVGIKSLGTKTGYALIGDNITLNREPALEEANGYIIEGIPVSGAMSGGFIIKNGFLIGIIYGTSPNYSEDTPSGNAHSHSISLEPLYNEIKQKIREKPSQ